MAGDMVWLVLWLCVTAVQGWIVVDKVQSRDTPTSIVISIAFLMWDLFFLTANVLLVMR